MSAVADVLREAARLMRERAENSATAMVGPLTWTFSPGGAADHLTCMHYQHMTPAVALAVADLLDETADLLPPDPHGEDEDCCCCTHARSALTLARAYLGETA